jgi:hypothetical protein
MTRLQRTVPKSAYTTNDLSVELWSAIVSYWNGKLDTERHRIADRCKDEGHDIVEWPVGLFCRRCCRYFES